MVTHISRPAGEGSTVGWMQAEFARTFTEEWEEAWNAHDVERLLVHYTDDVVFQSP
jgi:ketosteroid isomerase-like protein